MDCGATSAAAAEHIIIVPHLLSAQKAKTIKEHKQIRGEMVEFSDDTEGLT